MHIFTKAVTRVIFPGLILGIISLDVKARQQDSLATAVQDSITRSDASRLKVSGTITDASSGKPLDGVRISVEGYSAAITDENGRFTVTVPNFNTVLVISGLGFQTKEVPLRGQSSVSASLYEEGYSSIYETANLPFATKSGNRLVGAVETVNVNDNWQRGSESADTYLQGRVTGLNSIRRSGTPGIGASLFLRGYNSLYATNQPLIMVDGVIYDNTNFGLSLIGGHVDNPIANIDLKDVDNITVIKDATASTYGTKAANGVILITTARAKEQATAIDFAAYGGYNSSPSRLPVMEAGDYRTYLSDALYGYFRGQGYNELAAQNAVNRAPYMNSADPNYYKFAGNTDWQSKVMNSSYNQNYYLKVTGGDNIATYGLSVGYLNSKGITQNTDLQRYQTRFNANLNLSTKLKGNANLSFVSNSHNLKDQGMSMNTNPIFLSLTKSPFVSANEISPEGKESPNFTGVDNVGGEGFQRSNPAALIENMLGTNRNYRFMGSVGFNYEFNKQLNLQVLGGVTFSKVRENMFIPQNGVVGDTLLQDYAFNRSGTNVERLYALFTDTRLSYKKNIDYKHDLSTSVGLRFNDNQMETDYGLGFNSATDDYVTVGNGQSGLRRISGQNGDWRWLNLYGNVDYSLWSKYFLSFNLAVDGSSRFGKDAEQGLAIAGNKFAVMPSLGAAWLISSENFMANNSLVDVLKLRTSYGVVGNDDIGNYSAKQLYVSQNFFGTQGLVRGNVPNTSLQWESVTKFNVGVDAAFLNERLNVSFDVFNNRTANMLTLEPVRSVTGFNFGFTNNGEMVTNGMELGITGRLLNQAVKWDMGLNISNYKNEITRLPGNRMMNEYAGATILTQVGLPGNQFYGYRTNGVYSTSAEASAANLQNRRADGTITQFQAGDVRFVNTYDSPADKAAGIRVIDENDRQVIGNPNPDYTGMFSNMLSWKRFSFDAMFTFSVGNDAYNFVRQNLESMDGTQNQTLHVLNRWRAEGQVTDVPRAAIGDPNANSRFSDRWIEDASYLRLRTLSVSYNVPLKNVGIKSARVYLTGNNVFTMTKYLGYDPEFSASESIFTQGVDSALEPQFRSVQLGVRIGL